jgi:hypothetical protein
MRTIDEMVKQEVLYDVSDLVNRLAQGCGTLQPTSKEAIKATAALLEIMEQASELIQPIEDWEEAARQAGWIFDEGGPFWLKPTEHPFHEQGRYEKTAQEACEADDLVSHQWEVYEHWAVSQWLGEHLQAHGERVDFDFAGLVVWARTNTGQSIEADSVIEDIYRETHKEEDAA